MPEMTYEEAKDVVTTAPLFESEPLGEGREHGNS